ncbi:L-histidine N(alpha)-methyltransferase [Mesorhizobium xinjiangense]|uniref:L-histidine N(alpha)-methyltransferase n=1 Tax=Mesorhizobium xinjiangense TaxID=2678685 RepID=UPI001F2D863E|nr:L-histidine N(alpha)-methyltransferase [Mesorhizobium xinjiangense]
MDSQYLRRTYVDDLGGVRLHARDKEREARPMHDLTATTQERDGPFFSDVVGGLSRVQKTLPCRWLYDERGSDLFEAITRLPEYYPTRAETEILADRASEIAEFAGEDAVVVEYGAGAGVKTELVLDSLCAPQGYVPIDIAEEYLLQTAERMASRFPGLWVRPVACDFVQAFDMPPGIPPGRRIGFFPGSTIGNLDRADAETFLRQMWRHVESGGGAIVGVDLLKDVDVLLRAYDDHEGVTAAFNLNILSRINRELGADFRPERFRHEARWNEADKAVEMHLVSLAEQSVAIGERAFHFRHGETIHTESSRKYDRTGFASVAAVAGWDLAHVWDDSEGRFCVFALVASDDASIHGFPAAA